MLKPKKHLNLDRSILRVSADILKLLRKRRIMPLSKLHEKTEGKIGQDSELLFLPSLNFLFLLGKVRYHGQTDSIEYLELEKPKDAAQ